MASISNTSITGSFLHFCVLSLILHFFFLKEKYHIITVTLLPVPSSTLMVISNMTASVPLSSERVKSSFTSSVID